MVTRRRQPVLLESLLCVVASCALASCSPAAERADHPEIDPSDPLRCTTRGHLPSHCQEGPRDIRFAILPSAGAAEDLTEPTTAGQMTEQAAVAKRLFDAERWSEASTALLRVADGATGDDLGNRQIAEYHLAIAFFRLENRTAAADLFVGIAMEPIHIKFKESLLWVLKLLTDRCVTPALLEALGRYSTEPVADSNWNPPRPGAREAALFVVSRAQFEIGHTDEAATGFVALERDPTWGQLARECVALARERSAP